jgi:hypothetical protein
MSIKTRNFSTLWLIGALMALMLVVVACSSSDADGPGVTSVTDGAGVGTSDGGVLVTQSTSGDVDAGVWIGGETVAIPEIFAGLLGLSSGERVVWVTPGGPADGVLIMGDSITALGGVIINAENGLLGALAAREELVAGDSISLTIVRGGDASDVQITLANKPAHNADGGAGSDRGTTGSSAQRGVAIPGFAGRGTRGGVRIRHALRRKYRL